MDRPSRLSVLALIAFATGLGAAAATPRPDEPDLIKTPACAEARSQFEAVLAAGGPREQLHSLRRQTALACFGREPSALPENRAVRPPPAGPLEPIRLRAEPALTLAPAAPAPAGPPPARAVLGVCNDTGCWDNRGRHYQPQGSVLVAPDGRLCTRDGGALNCP